MINNSIKAANLKIIRSLKEAVKQVGVNRVAEYSGIDRGTIYFHLQELRAEKANLVALEKIQDAVDKCKKEDIARTNKITKKIKLS